MLWVASICVNMKAHNRNPADNLRKLIIEIAIKVFESATPPPKKNQEMLELRLRLKTYCNTSFSYVSMGDFLFYSIG